MLSSSFSVSLALGAITLLSQVSHSVAGVARPHGHLMGGLHRPRMASLGSGNRLHVEHRRDASARVDVSLADLQLLQSEYTSFHGWMNAWFNTATSDDQTLSVAQLKLEIQAYDEWINAWLATTMHSDPADKAQSLPPMSSVSLPSSSSINSNAKLSAPALSSSSNNAIPPIPASSSSSSSNAEASTPASLIVAENKHRHSRSLSDTIPTLSIQEPSAIYVRPVSAFSPKETQASSPISPISVPAPSTPASPPTKSSAPVNSPLPSSTPAQPIPSPSSAPSSVPSSPGSGSGSSSGGSFNAGSSSNLAVYWGQTPATASVPLSKLCADPSVDIVILAFLTTFFGPGGYPSVNFGSACGSGPNAAMNAKGATGLLACPDISSQIASCQAAGKKVLLSLGGALATSEFTSDDQATQFANKLWNLFGGGIESEDKDLRPFGTVALDGFDIDNENHNPAHYTAFTSALRKLSDSTSSQRKYYISAAPQCPRPDASIPLDAMREMDFIFVQFYNNGDCDVGAPGFLDSLKAWSADLAGSGSGSGSGAGAGSGPRVYIGAPACPSCAGQGYLDSESLAAQIASARGAGLANLGGVMLWDGSEAMQNPGFLGAVKGALT